MGTKAVFSPLVMVANALDEEGVAGVQVDGVIGVLAPLGHDDAGVELLAVEAAGIRATVSGSPISLIMIDVGPEGEDDHVLLLFAHGPQLEPDVHQPALQLLARTPSHSSGYS